MPIPAVYISTLCANQPISFIDPSGHKRSKKHYYYYTSYAFLYFTHYKEKRKYGASLSVDWYADSKKKKVTKIEAKLRIVKAKTPYEFRSKIGPTKKINNKGFGHVTAKVKFKRSLMFSSLPRFALISFDLWCYADGGRDWELEKRKKTFLT